MDKSATDLDLTAYHEAGHAAVAHAFGLPLHRVWVNPTMGDGGTDIRQKVYPRLQRALILLAGDRSEKLLDPASDRIAPIKDVVDLNTLVSERMTMNLPDLKCVERVTDRIRERLGICCERLLRERWSGVQRLAVALVDRHEVSGPDAEALLSASEEQS